MAIPPPGAAMIDREFIAALALCALGLTVAGVAAARPTPTAVTISATKTERPSPLSGTGPSR